MLRALVIGFYLVIRDINVYYRIDNEPLNIEYEDCFSPEKEDEIIIFSININSLRTES